MENAELLSGFINHSETNIYSDPNRNSEIVCEIQSLTEVLIDLANSSDDFYKIYTVIGMEGFCEKEYITVKR